MTQTITSADTSPHQVPGLHRALARDGLLPGKHLLDLGAGRYNKGIDYLRDHSASVWAYDPYNRPADQNAAALQALYADVIQITLCANVLNVINCREARRQVIELAALATEGAYFTVHEGDQSGEARQTNRGYQLHKPTRDYLPEILAVFDHAETLRGGKIIHAWNNPESR